MARGRSGGEDVWALRGVSLEIRPGEAVGLVGRNGSGKSTLLRVLAGIIKPTGGQIEVSGRVGSLLELGAGFHPDFSGRENVFLNGSIQGLRRAEIHRRFDEIVAFAELEHAIDRPVRTYSSGMTMRLGFAIAAFLQADVLLLDEVFAVGDENFQRKCFGVIAEFKHRGGTILFVSHDAQAVERLCERSVLLSHGEKAFDGPTHEAIVRYRRLLADELDAGEHVAELREWGSGEAEIVEARLLGPDGEVREQFLAGEPLALAVVLAAHRELPAPILHLEVRDGTGLLVAEDALDTGTVGWPAEQGRLSCASTCRTRHSRSAGCTCASAWCRSRVARSTSWMTGSPSSSIPTTTGAGSSGSEERGAPPRSRRCNELQVLPGLARADGARARSPVQAMSVADAQLPFDVLSKVSHQSLGEVEICCDLEHHVYNAAHTDSQIAAALIGTHWFEVHEWATSGQGGSSSHAA